MQWKIYVVMSLQDHRAKYHFAAILQQQSMSLMQIPLSVDLDALTWYGVER